MGGTESKPETPISQSAPKLAEKPWRDLNNNNQSLREDILRMKPKRPVNVLLLGPTGAGKSSLINSILTTARERRVNDAYTGNKETSFTTAYKDFKDDGIMQHCCLWDSMGIEQVLEGGLLLDDLEYLLKGHIKKGYEFNPRSKISESDAHFRRKPKIKHGIHCVVFVLDACMVNGRTVEQFMPKIKALQDRVHIHDIPCILILTKIDRLCEKVHEDVGNTFQSVKVYDAVKAAADMFGIPEGNIHPIRNSEVDPEINEAASNLVLIALKQLLHFAFDKIERLEKD